MFSGTGWIEKGISISLLSNDFRVSLKGYYSAEEADEDDVKAAVDSSSLDPVGFTKSVSRGDLDKSTDDIKPGNWSLWGILMMFTGGRRHVAEPPPAQSNTATAPRHDSKTATKSVTFSSLSLAADPKPAEKKT